MTGGREVVRCRGKMSEKKDRSDSEVTEVTAR